VKSPTKKINGELHKLCTGPAHDQPTWLPATEKYFYMGKSGTRAGKLTPRCRLCVNWNKLKSPGEQGWVPVSKVKDYFSEGVARVGMMEFARRTGLSETTLRDVILERSQRVQKRTVRKVMLEVISIRRKGEIRHRDDIRYGAELRGRPPKAVKLVKDLSEEEQARRIKMAVRGTT